MKAFKRIHHGAQAVGTLVALLAGCGSSSDLEMVVYARTDKVDDVLITEAPLQQAPRDPAASPGSADCRQYRPLSFRESERDRSPGAIPQCAHLDRPRDR